MGRLASAGSRTRLVEISERISLVFVGVLEGSGGALGAAAVDHGTRFGREDVQNSGVGRVDVLELGLGGETTVRDP